MASLSPKTLAIGGGALIGVAALALAIWPRPPSQSPAGTAPLGSLPHLTGAQSPEAPTPPEPVDIPAQVDKLMQRWRTAIRQKDPEGVLDCDRIFHEHPNEFGPALRSSAESDDDERVRAFSTRMLGKLRDGGSADLFAKLLKDPSAAVRGNAAWGLQQLGDQRAVAANAPQIDAGARSKVRRQASKEGRK
jgi:hypothetical protein